MRRRSGRCPRDRLRRNTSPPLSIPTHISPLFLTSSDSKKSVYTTTWRIVSSFAPQPFTGAKRNGFLERVDPGQIANAQVVLLEPPPTRCLGAYSARGWNTMVVKAFLFLASAGRAKKNHAQRRGSFRKSCSWSMFLTRYRGVRDTRQLPQTQALAHHRCSAVVQSHLPQSGSCSYAAGGLVAEFLAGR